MSPRAPAMSTQERRSELIDATIPLLHTKGREVSTRDIAAAAGVAEGTIFRVFESKQELVDAAVAEALSFDGLIARLQQVPEGLDLEQATRALVEAFRDRLQTVFTLMDAMGIVGPPPHSAKGPVPEDIACQVRRILDPHQAELSIPPARFAHILRLVAFAGSHPRIAHGEVLEADEMVHLLLDGSRVHTASEPLESNAC